MAVGHVIAEVMTALLFLRLFIFMYRYQTIAVTSPILDTYIHVFVLFLFNVCTVFDDALCTSQNKALSLSLVNI